MKKELHEVMCALDAVARLTDAIEDDDLAVQIAGVVRVANAYVADLHDRCERPSPPCPYEKPGYQATVI